MSQFKSLRILVFSSLGGTQVILINLASGTQLSVSTEYQSRAKSRYKLAVFVLIVAKQHDVNSMRNADVTIC